MDSLDQITQDIIQCCRCKQWKSLDEFYINRKCVSGRWSRQSWCRLCVRQHHQENRDDINAYKRAWYREHRESKRQSQFVYKMKLKIEVLVHYSTRNYPVCAQCGIRDIDVLTIDHIKGGGSEHKKVLGSLGSKLYYWLRQNDYPLGYQVLCFNCNFKKSLRSRHNSE